MTENQQAEAKFLRDAIDGVTKALSEGLPQLVEPLVSDHLRYLLEQEKLIFARQTVTAKPWYPDNSGEWVETFGNTPILSPGLLIERLSRGEREEEGYSAVQVEVGLVAGWADIVAYKVVKS